MTLSSIRAALVRTGREFFDDECPDSAASLTYYGVLSLFPAILVMVALLGVFGKKEPTTDMVLRIVADLVPPSALNTVRGPIEQLVDSSRADFALVVGLAVALWSASRYVAAFGRAMNRIHEVDEPRPVRKRIPRQLALTVSVLILAVMVALMLVVSGPLASAIGRAVGFGELALALWNIARWPVVLVCVGATIALLYHSTPNVRPPGFRWLSIGAAAAITVWLTASLGFAFYASQFGRFNETYGALA
ncbi:YihY/virulence factor BrkB family protein, partial [Mycolicibacterium gadium]|uniref:YihY/virulence factor BrkB family protein n=1 Tax=Mycolicibacterium gadium TaxID=1794 RepID=UPI002FDE0CF2